MRRGQHFGDGGEIAVLRMHQRIDVAEGEEIAGRRQAEDLIHRIRPVDAPARQIPIPQAAAAAAERGVDALAHAVAGPVGVRAPAPPARNRQRRARSARAPTSRAERRCEARRAPFGDDGGHRIDDSDLAEAAAQGAHSRQRIRAVGEADAQHASLFGEDRQRLGGAEIIGQRALDAAPAGAEATTSPAGLVTSTELAAGERARTACRRREAPRGRRSGLLQWIAEIVGDDARRGVRGRSARPISCDRKRRATSPRSLRRARR